MGTHYLCNLTRHYTDLDISYSHYGNLDQADFHSTVFVESDKGIISKPLLSVMPTLPCISICMNPL